MITIVAKINVVLSLDFKNRTKGDFSFDIWTNMKFRFILNLIGLDISIQMFPIVLCSSATIYNTMLRLIYFLSFCPFSFCYLLCTDLLFVLCLRFLHLSIPLNKNTKSIFGSRKTKWLNITATLRLSVHNTFQYTPAGYSHFVHAGSLAPWVGLHAPSSI